MKEHIYKGNKIVEYAPDDFMAYYFAGEDTDDIQSKHFNSLQAAEEYLDEKGYSLE